MFQIVCQNCGFVCSADRQLDHCISCSSKKATAAGEERERAGVSRELRLLDHVNQRLGQKYSCLRHLAGQNGFNAEQVVTALKHDEIFYAVLESTSMDFILRRLGMPEFDPHKPTVCCEGRGVEALGLE